MFPRNKALDRANQVDRELGGEIKDLKDDAERQRAEMDVLRAKDHEQEKEIAQLKMQIEELSKRVPVIKFIEGRPSIIEVTKDD